VPDNADQQLHEDQKARPGMPANLQRFAGIIFFSYLPDGF